jgi:hypothetical protein
MRFVSWATESSPSDLSVVVIIIHRRQFLKKIV